MRTKPRTEIQKGLLWINVPLGDGGNPSPAGEENVVILWSRAKISNRSAHEIGSEGTPGVDPQVPQAGTGGPGGGACARFAASDCEGA
jgi:hypothetical protein